MDNITKVILLLRSLSKKGISAYERFVKFLMKKYGFIVIQKIFELKKFWDRKIDILIIPYSFLLLENIKVKTMFIKKCIKNNSNIKIIRFFNEYNLREQGKFIKIWKERPIDYFICNFEGYHCLINYSKNVIRLNVNVLVYKEYNRKYEFEKKYDICYYGTFRRGRIDYFKKYIDKNIYLSISSQRKIRKFKELLGNDLKIIPAFKWNIKSKFRLFKYSLYIEDEYTHTHYNFPADRFYEALTYKVVQFFDINCKNTFDKYGIDISDFIVRDKKDLYKKVRETDYLKAWNIQKKWIKKVKREKREIEKKIDDFLNSIL